MHPLGFVRHTFDSLKNAADGDSKKAIASTVKACVALTPIGLLGSVGINHAVNGATETAFNLLKLEVTNPDYCDAVEDAVDQACIAASDFLHGILDNL